MTWVPMGSDPERHSALVEGVPIWMRRPLAEWMRPLVDGNGAGVLREYDQRRRDHSMLMSGILEDYGFHSLEDQLYDYPAEYIRILDFLVFKLTAVHRSDALEELDRMLLDCGSEWKVGSRDGHPGLEKRVPEGVQNAADTAMATPGHVGTLLAEAWHATFGVHPNAETAYRKAVLAVEAASVPVVIPTDKAATLGKVFAVMRDQGDWSLDVTKQHADYPADKVLLGMVQMLWAGQGRHAGQPDWAPNTQAEAEAALMLAVPLVQWFTSGAIQRRP